MELLVWATRPIESFVKVEPYLTRAEVFKMGVTHYFSIEKAKKELGYRPRDANDLRLTAEVYVKNRQTINGTNFLAAKKRLCFAVVLVAVIVWLLK